MTQQDIFVTATLNAWNGQVKRAKTVFDGLTGEQLLREVSPGRNTGIYLLGHLIAVNDGMLPLLGAGNRLFPELEEPFSRTPDKSGQVMPSVAELLNMWDEVHTKLAVYFDSLSPDQWLGKHTQMTDEDLLKEPHRNKLSVLISRTSHLAYHIGQVVLIDRSEA